MCGGPSCSLTCPLPALPCPSPSHHDRTRRGPERSEASHARSRCVRRTMYARICCPIHALVLTLCLPACPGSCLLLVVDAGWSGAVDAVRVAEGAEGQAQQRRLPHVGNKLEHRGREEPRSHAQTGGACPPPSFMALSCQSMLMPLVRRQAGAVVHSRDQAQGDPQGLHPPVRTGPTGL